MLFGFRSTSCSRGSSFRMRVGGWCLGSDPPAVHEVAPFGWGGRWVVLGFRSTSCWWLLSDGAVGGWCLGSDPPAVHEVAPFGYADRSGGKYEWALVGTK